MHIPVYLSYFWTKSIFFPNRFRTGIDVPQTTTEYVLITYNLFDASLFFSRTGFKLTTFYSRLILISQSPLPNSTKRIKHKFSMYQYQILYFDLLSKTKMARQDLWMIFCVIAYEIKGWTIQRELKQKHWPVTLKVIKTLYKA